jgi:hypothetical protein
MFKRCSLDKFGVLIAGIIFLTMSFKSQLPRRSDFPPEVEFVIKEFDVPLVNIPGKGWFNWFGGTPQPYDASSLRVDNNWSAKSFDEWVGIVAASMASRIGKRRTW